VLDDEQELVVGLGQWVLGRQQPIEIEVVGIRHRSLRRTVDHACIIAAAGVHAT
jgi:hypothetical protein